MNKKVKIISLVSCIILISVVLLRGMKIVYGEDSMKHGVLVNIDGIDRIVFENKEDIDTYLSKVKEIYSERHNDLTNIDIRSNIVCKEGEFLLSEFSTPKDYAQYTMDTKENIVQIYSESKSYGLEGEEVLFPTRGVITSSFGSRSDPFSGNESFHKGIDIGAPMNSSIYSPVEGKVILSGWVSGYGNTLIISTGDMEVLFGHCNELLLKCGDTVCIGQEIARVGSTGNSTGPHLHLEVKENGNVISPSDLLK